jgi:hypothetical protein
MNRTALIRLAALLIAIATIAAVGIVAYNYGMTNSAGGPELRGMPMHGRMLGWGHEPGIELFGLVALVAVGLLLVWLLAALMSPNRGGPTTAGPAAGDLERLNELSAMHDQGKLTDEEFTAAKRKLLGLQ